MKEFQRINRLPPYVLNIVNQLKIDARKKATIKHQNADCWPMTHQRHQTAVATNRGQLLLFCF